ncbi:MULTISPECIES: helix-turn-helix transcriptional regulator [unclassified Nocardioides]|uniref:helix-turn-helix transcriptional regulator n=1 Tax=unclassified Nocardioides TaxID=2615069 RepID=UPI0011541E2E|nr:MULTISPECIES: helix-turn-helix transcriptional regulator [unclassified Nocardioides]TQK72124.1 regulatory LuxR family protein [Nocardioides sp. SLBN-35]WGY03658.1 helix-turn-helix transcriptional regulator [Nocardioides sp. QY071]
MALDLARTVAEFHAAGRGDMAFGGPVTTGGAAIHVTALHGAKTGSLRGLRVRSGYGLGGKALLLGRPASVTNYYDARGITHQYDVPVRAEELETVTALPIMVDRAPRMVVYIGHRTQVHLGDVWYDAFLPLVRRVERELAVDDEVRRRLAGLEPVAQRTTPDVALTRADLRDISDELADLASLVQDEALRARLEEVRSRVDHGRSPAGPAARRTGDEVPTGLAAREVDVLAHVALGQSNREVADSLGIVESTVKSYLKNAMRKLHATNRVHAVRLAREAGVID